MLCNMALKEVNVRRFANWRQMNSNQVVSCHSIQPKARRLILIRMYLAGRRSGRYLGPGEVYRQSIVPSGETPVGQKLEVGAVRWLQRRHTIAGARWQVRRRGKSCKTPCTSWTLSSTAVRMTLINLNKFFFSLRSKLMHETFEYAILCSSCQLIDPCMLMLCFSYQQNHYISLNLDDFENLDFPHFYTITYAGTDAWELFKVCNIMSDWLIDPCIRFFA